MNIDELERLAAAATPGPWEGNEDGVATRVGNRYRVILSANMYDARRERDTAYIAAAYPDVMAKLIAVVRAAQDASALIDRISEGREWGAIEEYGTALREAIAALKGTP